MRFKGVSPALEIVIGLVVSIFILMIAFKLLGIYTAYQYEQQAQITAKNLQTAMNAVCVTGQSMEVNVDFPQKLSSGGVAMHPLQILGSILTRRGEAITNALRYTTALQSYGDPWYVIYYENFPLGEEEGWEGWSDVAAMRTISVASVGIDQAMCISSIIPYTSVGRRIGGAFKKGGKWVVKKSLGRIAESIKRGKKTQRAIDVTMHTKEIIESGAEESAKEVTFKNNIYKKMIASGVKIKGGMKEIYNWFKLGADDIVKQIKAASRLERVAKDIPAVSDEMLDTPAGKTLTRKLIKYSDDILNNKEITNREARDIAENIKKIAKGTDTDQILKTYSKEVAERLDRYKVKVQNPLYNFEPKEQKVITNLIDKLDSGAKIKPKEVEQVYKIIGKRGEVALDEWDDYLKDVGSVSEIQNFAKRVTPGHMIVDSKPYTWTRGFLSIGEGAPRRLPGLGKALKYTALGTRIEGKRVATRYGVWYLATDNPWISFSDALSLADVSMLKFSPCSDHALCLKSQVNPSITIYPLDECKEAGINYIELEKYPEGGSIGTGFSRWIDENFGKAPYSKFYTASPCAGKIIINKTRCSCSGKEEPIIDDSTLDTYIFDCKLDDNNCIGSGCGITCKVTKNMSYLEPPVTEDLGTVSFSGEVVGEDIGGGDKKYEVNFDVGDFIWRIYRSDIPTEGKMNCTKYILDRNERFSCEFDLPVLVGFTTACEGSNLWLECVNWTEEETETKELHTLEGSKKIEITKWCCLQWNLTGYGLANKPTRKIINVSDCEDYDWGILGVGGQSKHEVESNLESALTETNASGHSIWNISDNITKLQNYADSVKEDVVKAIKNSSEIELKKGQNPNEEDINQLLMYNLRPEQTIPCLKVTYLKDDTKGFCYSSPAGTEKAKELFYMGASIAADIGVTTLSAFIPGVGPATAGVAGCEVGNLIMWAGQYQVSKEREEHLWPHNTFFGNYYTK